MTDEISYFRKRLLGGFNRQDVLDYITKLAQERNELRNERDEAVLDAGALADEVVSLRRELEGYRTTAKDCREKEIAAIETAMETFTELESALKGLSGEVAATIGRANEEFKNACDTFEKIPSILERTGMRFIELRTLFDGIHEKATDITDSFDDDSSGPDDDGISE